ncbi:MAG TPA: TetR/AcrR family transcriptional regulator [Vineibacter sp.]|nr:TetR/AcrR family transcriptional regulator [Vineibacter sp.]
MKKKPISEETRTAILNATWALIAEKKRLDIGQVEIAAAAGVSRQTVYLAFGSRAGLLTAMARNRDLQSDHVVRLGQISHADTVTPEDFQRYIEVWLDYLPLIYPVGILLDAAALIDAEAASAWNDRMKGALLAGLKRICRQLAKGGHLVPGLKPDRAAEQAWSLIHPTAWHQLVVECGWSPKEFRHSRLEIIRATLLR